MKKDWKKGLVIDLGKDWEKDLVFDLEKCGKILVKNLEKTW